MKKSHKKSQTSKKMTSCEKSDKQSREKQQTSVKRTQACEKNSQKLTN